MEAERADSRGMKSREAHFVLVHGASHGAWCWYKVLTLLKAAGHRVTALDMIGSGINPKPIEEVGSISDYCKPLLEFMESLPPEADRVVLVGHRIGGACISTALEIFPQKIAVAVFVTSFMPGPHLPLSTIIQQVSGVMGSYMDSKFIYGRGPDKPPTSILPGPELLRSKVYNLSPPEDSSLATLLIRPFVYGEPLEQMALTEERYGSVRRVYVVSEQDRLLTEEFQRWNIK